MNVIETLHHGNKQYTYKDVPHPGIYKVVGDTPATHVLFVPIQSVGLRIALQRCESWLPAVDGGFDGWSVQDACDSSLPVRREVYKPLWYNYQYIYVPDATLTFENYETPHGG